MKIKFNNKLFSIIGDQSVTAKGTLLVIDSDNKESEYKGGYVGKIPKDIKVLNAKGKLSSDSIETANDIIVHGKCSVDTLKSNYVELHGSFTSRLIESNIVDLKFSNDSEIDYIKCNSIDIDESDKPFLLDLNKSVHGRKLIIHKLECNSANLFGNITIGKLICTKLTKNDKVNILK